MSQLPVLVVRLLIAFLVLLPSTQTLLAVQTTPPPAAPGTVQMLNELLPFDWVDASTGFGPCTSMNTDHGRLSGGTGFHSSVIADGELHVQATSEPEGTSYDGRWISLRGKRDEPGLTLDLADPMPSQILAPFRVHVSAIRVRVRGEGQYRIEIKGADESVLFEDSHSLDTPEFVDAYFLLPTLSPAKVLNLIVESTPVSSDLRFDRIDLVCNVPTALHEDSLLYALLTSYCQLLRAYDRSGLTRDHNSYPSGVFDAVPATGMQIAAAAVAADIGFVSTADAREIARRSAAALLAIHREPATGLLPHLLLAGQRKPGTEWSSVDTALACVAAIEGLTALGLSSDVQEIYSQIIEPLDIAAFTNADGEILHGVAADGTLLENAWTQWGGELTMVEILRALHDPTLPPATADRDLEHYCGRGFIIELAALFLPQFGAAGYGRDQYGVDWHARRVQHMQAQVAFTGHSLWGMSPVEIISYENPATAYLEGGIGAAAPACEPVQTVPNHGDGPWIAPHYMSMVAGLDPCAAADRIEMMRSLGVWPPINGPAESVELNDDGSVHRWHRVQISLNAAFNVFGLYKGLCSRDRRRDVIYRTAEADGRLKRAVNAVFHGNQLPGDFDRDEDIDQSDTTIWRACTTRAAVPYTPLSPSCSLEPNSQGYMAADFDRDGDVDLDDFGWLQRWYTGPVEAPAREQAEDGTPTSATSTGPRGFRNVPSGSGRSSSQPHRLVRTPSQAR